MPRIDRRSVNALDQPIARVSVRHDHYDVRVEFGPRIPPQRLKHCHQQAAHARTTLPLHEIVFQPPHQIPNRPLGIRRPASLDADEGSRASAPQAMHRLGEQLPLGIRKPMRSTNARSSSFLGLPRPTAMTSVPPPQSRVLWIDNIVL
jgi:hypothetical protein